MSDFMRHQVHNVLMHKLLGGFVFVVECVAGHQQRMRIGGFHDSFITIIAEALLLLRCQAVVKRFPLHLRRVPVGAKGDWLDRGFHIVEHVANKVRADADICVIDLARVRIGARRSDGIAGAGHDHPAHRAVAHIGRVPFGVIRHLLDNNRVSETDFLE